MIKWYNESYFNKNNWLLENFDNLNLSSDETLLLLLIIQYKQNRKAMTNDLFAKKLNKSLKEIDKLISSLVSKGYLKLSINSKGLVLDIDNIFEFDPGRFEISENKDIFDIAEEVFAKPFSPTELQKINDLINEYGQDNFIEALRISEANRKIKLSYVEGILRNEKK